MTKDGESRRMLSECVTVSMSEIVCEYIGRSCALCIYICDLSIDQSTMCVSNFHAQVTRSLLCSN